MNNYENIKMTVEQLEKKLKEACDELNLSVQQRDDKSNTLTHFKFGEGGIIAIYNTKNGLNLKHKFGKMQDVGLKLLELAFGGECAVAHIQSTVASYKNVLSKFISIEKFTEDFKDLVINELMCKIEIKNKAQYAVFSWDVIRGTEKVTINCYMSSLVLQGKNNFLWDNICNWIEQKLDSPVSEMLVRFTGDENINRKINQSVIDEAEEILKNRLGSAYDILFTHDRRFLNSAICLILHEIPLQEYSAIINPAFKGLEGYFRKMIAEKIGSRKSEVMQKVYDPKQSLKWLVDKDTLTGTYYLKSDYRNSSNPSSDRAFERLYIMYKEERNPYSHSTGTATRTCDNIDDAKDLVDQILSAITSTYSIFSR